MRDTQFELEDGKMRKFLVHMTGNFSISILTFLFVVFILRKRKDGYQQL